MNFSNAAAVLDGLYRGGIAKGEGGREVEKGRRRAGRRRMKGDGGRVRFARSLVRANGEGEEEGAETLEGEREGKRAGWSLQTRRRARFDRGRVSNRRRRADVPGLTFGGRGERDDEDFLRRRRV